MTDINLNMCGMILTATEDNDMTQENASDGPNKKVSFSAQLMDKLEREGAINRYRNTYEALPGEDADESHAPDPYPSDPRCIAKCYADLFSILVKGFPEISTDESFAQLQTLYFQAGSVKSDTVKLEKCVKENEQLQKVLDERNKEFEDLVAEYMKLKNVAHNISKAKAELYHLIDLHKNRSTYAIHELSDTLYRLVQLAEHSPLFFLRKDWKDMIAAAYRILQMHRIRSIYK